MGDDFYLGNQQSYAELEKDTPGQIMGVTHKTDGKSDTSSESTSASARADPISERFTQKAADDDRYSTHDQSDTHEYRTQQAEKRYYYVGAVFTIIITIYCLMLSSDNQSYLDSERDRTLRERQERSNSAQQFGAVRLEPDNQPRSV